MILTPEFFSGQHEYGQELSGLTTKQAERQLSLHMKNLPWDERNELVPLACHISEFADYGFAEGEVVKYRFSEHTTREGEILRIRKGYADFKDIRLPLTLVWKSDPEQIELF